VSSAALQSQLSGNMCMQLWRRSAACCLVTAAGSFRLDPRWLFAAFHCSRLLRHKTCDRRLYGFAALRTPSCHSQVKVSVFTCLP
jgi:hypothetical protein